MNLNQLLGLIQQQRGHIGSPPQIPGFHPQNGVGLVPGPSVIGHEAPHSFGPPSLPLAQQAQLPAGDAALYERLTGHPRNGLVPPHSFGHLPGSPGLQPVGAEGPSGLPVPQPTPAPSGGALGSLPGAPSLPPGAVGSLPGSPPSGGAVGFQRGAPQGAVRPPLPAFPTPHPFGSLPGPSQLAARQAFAGYA